MSVLSRVEKIEEEIRGVASQYGVTSWELGFLETIKSVTVLSEKREAVLKQIEKKVFEEGDD